LNNIQNEEKIESPNQALKQTIVESPAEVESIKVTDRYLNNIHQEEPKHKEIENDEWLKSVQSEVQEQKIISKPVEKTIGNIASKILNPEKIGNSDFISINEPLDYSKKEHISGAHRAIEMFSKAKANHNSMTQLFSPNDRTKDDIIEDLRRELEFKESRIQALEREIEILKNNQ
jgi:hypothetical protein